MTSRGSADISDKLFGALVYLLPLMDALPFGKFLLAQFPVLGLIYVPFQPLIAFYFQFPFAGFIIFLVLFMAVVRNERISHFIRFNAMQAILIGILISLLGLVLSVLLPGLGIGLLTQTLFNLIFLGGFVASLYGVVQSIFGRYAEIPSISEAAYSQVRW